MAKPIIFVFGSNLAGRHGKGAALTAKLYHGAVYGVGEGRTGNSYAIPTKDQNLKTRPLPLIQWSVEKFIDYAKEYEDLLFMVTAIGTGLAGYKVEDIAPFFKHAPKNCILPDSFRLFHD